MKTPLAEPVPSELWTCVTEPGSTRIESSTRPDGVLSSIVYGGRGMVPLGRSTAPPAGTSITTLPSTAMVIGIVVPLAAWMSYKAGSSRGGGLAHALIAAISAVTIEAKIQRIGRV